MAMRYFQIGICAVTLLIVATPGLAINKCTAADGKIVFQDSPCDGGTKAEEIKAASSVSASNKSWQFFKRKDDMTGVSTCFAIAPSAAIWTLKGVPGITLQIAMRGDTRSTVLRTNSDSDLFHNDISGMGIKVDGNGFLQVSRKVGSNVVGFSATDEVQLLEQLSAGKSFRARLRFWPWDALGDTDSIPLTGFKQAYALALSCAKNG